MIHECIPLATHGSDSFPCSLESQVEDVTLARRGEQVVGTLHLTPHHIIFSHIPQGIDNAQAQGAPVRPKELWITYPIIAFCTYRPNPAASRQPSSIRLRCRDFTFVCFYFTSESKARDVYESIKLWTCKIGRIDKLYAFTYQPPPPEREINGWELYNARKEWARQGVGRDSNENGWRISEINMDYGVSILLFFFCVMSSDSCIDSGFLSFHRRTLLFYQCPLRFQIIRSTTRADTDREQGCLF